MIVLEEHFGNNFRNKDKRYVLNESNLEVCNKIAIENNDEVSAVFNNNKDSFCYKLNKTEDGVFQFETNYYIGIDWIGETSVPIYVQPKVNKNTEIDYLSILFEALEEPSNFNHLEDLYTIDFTAPLIEIEQHQDKLTPLLLLEFLQVTKKLVRKGLKKSYYKVTENLNSRVKGKILVNATVKQNHSKQKMLYNVCRYEEFGFNSIENKILKKALLFTSSALSNLEVNSKINIKEVFSYVSPAFQHIDKSIDIRELKNRKVNPLFKEYTQALKLAELILKRYGYNISKTTVNKIKTPPFWINMPKLFELYILKKLKCIFPNPKEVIYQKQAGRQFLDYLLNSKYPENQMVIDAKYKPKYEEGNISKDDARQISGYARLKSVYAHLGIEQPNRNKMIDCLVIYSDQSKDSFELDLVNKKEDEYYQNIFKIGVKLPEITINK